ncbi:uncharacterized protein N7518_003229 [Penicillium psychrosexuale]|uniref:uncharacterized protein n=1 Tax=Penicillium psychrosexuale TaxID=1002107 RepID=UPI002545A2B3|nr:uncharacterized protein N7518_003229 [Penicillium psychrosexuale]KAJ5801161.1 hypothetical protein N7518_003229 [Penicillium psychrosexuale]
MGNGLQDSQPPEVSDSSFETSMETSPLMRLAAHAPRLQPDFKFWTSNPGLACDWKWLAAGVLPNSEPVEQAHGVLKLGSLFRLSSIQYDHSEAEIFSISRLA